MSQLFYYISTNILEMNHSESLKLVKTDIKKNQTSKLKENGSIYHCSLLYLIRAIAHIHMPSYLPLLVGCI